MNRFLSALLAVFATWVFIACGEKPAPVPPQEMEVFALEVSDITPTSCHFAVVPADEDMTYVTMLVPKADFDEFEDEYKYQDNDLEWFEKMATEAGQTLGQWLSGFLKKGRFEADEAGLMPGESYIFMHTE